MDPSTLLNLQNSVESAAHSSSSEEKIAALSQAFKLFTEETSRLESAYSNLKKQYASVNWELQEKNKLLEQTIFEFDITNAYLDSILTNISQGLIFITLEGIITTYNPAAATLLEKKQTEVLNQPFLALFNDTLLGFSMSEALKTASSPRRLICTLPHGKIPNEEKQLEIETTVVLKDDHGQKMKYHSDFTKGIIVMIRDVTEIKRMQTILNRNDRMKELGEMAAMVAHEIRNPLGGIKGFASLLMQDLKDNPNLCSMASNIVQGTDSLNRLVTNVLNYSRPLQPILEKKDLCKLFDEIETHIKVDPVLSQHIKIQRNISSCPFILPFDAELMRGVFLNLIINAEQAAQGNVTVTISTRTEGNYAYIDFTDNGPGIEPTILEKIFRPFFTTKPQGHGFGLAEVFRVVQAHSGDVEAKSEVGKGATFTIKLPLEPFTKDSA